MMPPFRRQTKELYKNGFSTTQALAGAFPTEFDTGSFRCNLFVAFNNVKGPGHRMAHG